ncbi:MAG: PASTA domain-containing protein, partial [Rikenellaceae bacterium]|nr:PASTA domain-containing protein [Rikenellaceae bacterium]
MGFLNFLKKHLFIRHLLLAGCFIIIFVALSQVVLNCSTRHGQAYRVPNFNGMNMTEAQRAAQQAKLQLTVIDSLYFPALDGGIILEQNPAPGASVKSGRRIFLTINAYNAKMSQIPYVAGYSLRQAKNNLEVADFEIDRLIYKDDIAVNNVLEQQYNGRTVTANSHIMAPTGSGVTLIVGRGQEGQHFTKVPKVIGLPLKDAKSRLWEVGLNIGTVSRDEQVSDLTMHMARVSRQSPGVGTPDTRGTTVARCLPVSGAASAAGPR